MMNRVLNPFRYIAGMRALLLGVVFIVATSLLEWSGGVVQDGYLHFTLKQTAWVWVLVGDVAMWLLSSLLLWVCGVAFSRSCVRVVDVFGTMAFARLLLLPMVAPLLLPSMQQLVLMLMESLAMNIDMATSQMAMLSAMGVWTTAWLVLYLVWNYNAFSVSCNLRGAKAVTIFVVVQLLCVVLGGMLQSLIY